MSKFPIDLKQFKKISEDKHHTVLRHANGHELKIAHAALGGEMKHKLKEVPLHEDKKMLEEREKEERLTAREKLFNKPKKEKHIGKHQDPAEFSQDPYAEGGDVKIEKDAGIGWAGSNGEASQMRRLQNTPVQPNPSPSPQNNAYGGDVKSNRYNPKLVESKKVPHFDDGGLVGEEKPTPLASYLQDAAEVPTRFANTGVPYDTENVLSATPTEEEAQPTEAPRMPAAAQTLEPAITHAPGQPQQTSQTPPNAIGTMMGQGIQEEVGGLRHEAGALGNIGTAQAEALYEQNQAGQANQDLFQNNVAENEGERQNIAQDLQDMHIDPLKYIHDMGTGQKIATGIGLILGGMGGGLMHQENPALKFLNQQIDRSIEAQKMQIGKQQNLLSANLQKFKNLRDAADFTRVNLNDMTARQLQEAAAKSADPLAQARAEQAIGKLHRESGMIMGRLNAMQTINDPRASDQDVNNSLGILRFVAPDQAKEAEARVVPGVGVSQTGPVPQETRNTLVSMKTLNDRAADLLKDAEQFKVTGDPRIRASMGTKAHEIMSFLGDSIHTGQLTPGKMPYLEAQIGDPNGFVDNLIRDNTKLKETINGNQRRYNITVQGAGIPLKHGSISNATGPASGSSGFVPKSFKPLK